MSRYTARATRARGWWAIDVPELPGVFTQARRLDQVESMARLAISLMLGVEPESIEVEVAPNLDPDTDQLVTEAIASRSELEAAQARQSELMRRAAAALTGAGFSVRDTGMLLRVSPQRVSQLLGSA